MSREEVVQMLERVLVMVNTNLDQINMNITEMEARLK